jgi:hypothetical protein
LAQVLEAQAILAVVAYYEGQLEASVAP